MTDVHFYWDVASPYTYLAFTQIERLMRQDVRIIGKPVFLKSVLSYANNVMPAGCLNKSRHISDDLQRWRDRYGVTMKLPFEEVRFPIDTSIPMCVALLARERGVLMPYMKTIFQAYWQQGLRIDKPAVLASAIDASDEHIDQASQECFVQALDNPNFAEKYQSILSSETKQAVERGVFGLPTFFIEGDMYFGNDRLGMLEAHLANEAIYAD